MHRTRAAGVGGWGATKGRRLICREKFWVDGGNKIIMEELLRMWRKREFQVVAAATAKLREPKHVRTRESEQTMIG